MEPNVCPVIVLVKILPYIALATKPGVTITDIGIPNNSENKKAMEAQADGTSAFLLLTVDFQRRMLPYSDKDNLISAILPTVRLKLSFI